MKATLDMGNGHSSIVGFEEKLLGFVDDLVDLQSSPPRSTFRNRSVEVAPDLLGMVICNGDKYLGITEVEAYGGSDDEASHAFKGITKRNKSMFADAGMLYVYLSYGIHKCINVVTGDIGTGEAILIRSGISLVPAGDSEMSMNVIRGPGRVGQWLAASLGDDGRDLLSDQRWRLVDIRPKSTPRIMEFSATKRIGISKATELEWRFETDAVRLAELLHISKVN